MSWQEKINAELDARRAADALRRRYPVAQGAGRWLVADDRQYLNFSSNDYLGLSHHPQIIRAWQQGAEQFGVGSGGSGHVSGYSVAHQALEEELAETVFYHNHPRHNNEIVLYNIRQRNNLVLLFTLDQSVYNFLRQQYPNVYFYSQASPLSDFFASKSRLGNSCKMYVHLRREAMDVFCFEYGRLMLGNCLQCSVTADRLYYLLYLWKTLGFDQERDEMHLTGYLADKEQLLPELQKFIRQVFIMNPASNLDLQAITTCE